MKLVEKVRALAAAHPYGVAEDKYVWAGQPECIIGHALVSEGWSVDALEGETRSVWALCRSGTIPGVSVADERWLQRVQTAQDEGHTWAVAVELADKEWGQ